MKRLLYMRVERMPLSRGAAVEALTPARPPVPSTERPAARAAPPLKKWASRLNGTWHLTRLYALKANAPHLARMAIVNPAAVEFDLFGFTNHMARDIERNGCHCERAAQLLENARAAAAPSSGAVDPLTAGLWGRMHLGLGEVSMVVASRLLPTHALREPFPAVQYHFNSSGTSSRPAGGGSVAPFAPAAPHYVITQFGGEFWLESNGLQYHPSPATWALGRTNTPAPARGKSEIDLMMHATHSMVPHVAGTLQRHRAKLGISVCAIAPTRMLADPDAYPSVPAAPVDAGGCDTHHRTNVPLETLRLEGSWGGVRPENNSELLLVSEWQRDAPPQ